MKETQDKRSAYKRAGSLQRFGISQEKASVWGKITEASNLKLEE
jgi:hypothetical protein